MKKVVLILAAVALTLMSCSPKMSRSAFERVHKKPVSKVKLAGNFGCRWEIEFHQGETFISSPFYI